MNDTVHQYIKKLLIAAYNIDVLFVDDKVNSTP